MRNFPKIAAEAQLRAVPGLTPALAREIAQGRPYAQSPVMCSTWP